LGKAKIWPMTAVPCSPAAHDKDWRPTKILKRSESKPTKEPKKEKKMKSDQCYLFTQDQITKQQNPNPS
jgi:hypothetical protein